MNLDSLSQTELYDFWYQWGFSGYSRQQALNLLGKRPGYTKLPNLLARYARSKLEANNARLSGNIQQALACEDVCDYLYNQLPSDLKW